MTFRKFLPTLTLSKREKFVITSIILCLGFVGINFVGDQYRFLSITALTLLTLILFIFSLWEGLGINPTLLTLILPPLFTLGVGIFWFLLPTNIFARLPVVALFGLGIYSLSLTANIFTVSAIRTIALVRAARGVGFVLTLLTAFLLFDAIISIKASIFITGLGIALVSLFLFLQGLWTSSLEKKDLETNNIFLYSFVFAWAISQISILLYLWPSGVVVGSLFLTVGIYILLGLGQAQLEERFFKQTIQEYLTVGLVVFVTMIFATHWGG